MDGVVKDLTFSVAITLDQIKKNRGFYYLRSITLKRVTSLQGLSLRNCACGDASPFEEMSERRRDVGNTASDSTGPRFEPRTSHSRDERVTARPTGRSITLDEARNLAM